jgi:hypothetical protein
VVHYLSRLIKVTIIVAIEAVEVLIANTSVVESFFEVLFVGTTISQPGFISLLEDFDTSLTPPFMYIA